MHEVSHSFIALAKTLELRWQSYRSSGDFDQFVEFTLSLNGLTERLNQQNLPGLASACQELENRALGLFTDHTLRPVSDEQAAAISQQLGAILQLLQRHETPAVITKRLTDHADDERDLWIRQRNVLIVSRPGHPWSAALVEQLSFYGFRPHILGWDDEAALDEAPLAIVLVPDHEASTYPPQALDALQRLKARYVASYVYCLSVPASLEAIVGLQRAGANVCIPAEIKLSDILSRILDLVESREQETHRVLIVEDSKTAVAHIQRALDLHGIDSRAINTPLALLQVCAEFRPHAILMDMYMPFCTGVEVTRALRQIPEYQSLPVIYLSGEADIGQQVEALRLGGDQFLTKPANPIILSAVVKTKIDRYRDMLRSGRHDSLTGLLNRRIMVDLVETELKLVERHGHPMTVAFIDLDHFKSINDSYGHEAGDKLLCEVAHRLRLSVREGDTVARLGGDEFVVMLEDLGETAEEACEKGVAIGEKILAALNEPFLIAGERHRNTPSIGVTCFGSADERAEDLLRRADAAMYRAKAAGRNRLETNGGGPG